MKIQSRLSKSLQSLATEVLPNAESSHDSFLVALRCWYQQFIIAIDRNTDIDFIQALLNSTPSDLPVTDTAIQHCRNQLTRYFSGDLDWCVGAIHRTISILIVHRDWENSCDEDQGDLEYFFDLDAGAVVKICELCQRAFTDDGRTVERPSRLRPATKRELITAGVLPTSA